VTAIPQRRRKRTVIAAVLAVVMVIVASAMVVVGAVTLYNSQEGEAVGVDTRPRETFPATPNALLAVTDDEGALASVVVLTLLPEGQGGSIVTLPVNVDATAGFGVQRRPLNEFFDASDPEAFTVAVSDMLSVTIEQTLIVDPAGLAALLAPIESVSAVLPDAAIDTDAIRPDGSTPATTSPDTVPDSTDAGPTDSEPNGSGVPTTTEPESGAVDAELDGVVVSAGPQVLDMAQVVDALTAIDESVPAYDQHPLDVAIWTALASTAPVDSPPEPVATDAEGRPVPPSSVEQLLVELFQGPVGVRDIAADPPPEATNPTGADVVVLDRSDSMLVFASISPALMSTPNVGPKFRIVAQYSDEQLAALGGSYDTNSDVARELIAGLLFVQANIVSVDTASAVAPAVTLIQVSDPRLLEEATKTSETLFGPVEVVLAPTVLEGVDQVVTLGESYLALQAAAARDREVLPDETVPGTTVDGDG
jgi:hypothetical protein